MPPDPTPAAAVVPLTEAEGAEFMEWLARTGIYMRPQLLRIIDELRALRLVADAAERALITLPTGRFDLRRGAAQDVANALIAAGRKP